MDSIKLQANQVIVVDPEKCTGCRSCEMACSIRHFDVCGPNYSRIRIQEFGDGNTYIPVLCQACEEAVCIHVCPMNARIREESGAVVTDEDTCVGCRACVYACPFSAPVVNPETGKTMSCHFCVEDELGPWCVKACATEKALRLLDTGDAARVRSREWARQWKQEQSYPRTEHDKSIPT